MSQKRFTVYAIFRQSAKKRNSPICNRRKPRVFLCMESLFLLTVARAHTVCPSERRRSRSVRISRKGKRLFRRLNFYLFTCACSRSYCRGFIGGEPPSHAPTWGKALAVNCFIKLFCKYGRSRLVHKHPLPNVVGAGVILRFVGFPSERNGEFASFAERAVEREFPAGLPAYFLNHGKSESETAVFPAVRFIHGKEP